MKKCAVFLAVLGCLLLGGTLSVRAQSTQEIYEEQWEASGAPSLYESLPAETQALLENIGVDALSLEAMSAMEPQTVFSALADLFSNGATVPFSAVLTMLGTLLLLGLFSTLMPQVDSHSPVFRTIALLTAVTPLLVPLWQTLQRAQAATESAAVFSMGFAPVYAGTLAAQGYTASSVSYQTVMLAAAEGISLLSQSVIMPLLTMALALGIGGALQPENRLGEAGGLINRAAVWLLGITLTLFVGMLSIQGVLSASADSVGGRVLRFSVAGFVPVVGGSLAEALYTVRGCLSALRGTVGGCGMLCAVMIVLPTFLECVAWNLLLSLAGVVAKLFSFPPIVSVIGVVQGIVKALIAVLSSSVLLMIVSLSLVMLVGGGTS